MNYKKAIEKILLRRKNDLIYNENRILSAMRENETLHKTDIEIRTIEQDRRKGKAYGQDKLNQLKLKRAQILSDLGISENPPPRCSACGDTGINGDKPCACVITIAGAAESITDATFSSADLDVFDKSDRPLAQRIYSYMQAFCDKFPPQRLLNILLIGGTGTGKTYLASCIANRLSESGFSVMFLSAFGFVNRMLNYHTAPMDEKLDYLSPVIDCDLLIIDDLGTESLLKNVTVEYLYSVLNERMRFRRHTMITTNFDEEMLAKRYGERVFSRLFDKRISASYVIAQKDIRKL